MILRGSLERLAPVLMTALVAMMGATGLLLNVGMRRKKIRF